MINPTDWAVAVDLRAQVAGNVPDQFTQWAVQHQVAVTCTWHDIPPCLCLQLRWAPPPPDYS